MSTPADYREAVGTLKDILNKADQDEFLRNLIQAKDQVLSRYQEVFTLAGIAQLEAEDFREFLMFKNNQHWTGLQRLGPPILSNIKALRAALQDLINEEIPVAQRLNDLLPGGKAKVRKLGKAVLTPILLITHPKKYGVWNGTSEGAMKALQLWPDFQHGLSLGDRYVQLNDLFLRLANDLSTDLWTLDALWWKVNNPELEEDIEAIEGTETISSVTNKFGLERHLQDFLLENWEQTQLNQEWELVEEGGDIKGYGYERPTDIGKIDLLAKHKTEGRWLVIELKRAQTSDDTVGQVARYMGWVKKNLASSMDKVEGLIIALDDDQKLKYALEVVPDIRFLRYQVEFKLVESKE